jgi:small subunit ribosomal protein S12
MSFPYCSFILDCPYFFFPDLNECIVRFVYSHVTDITSWPHVSWTRSFRRSLSTDVLTWVNVTNFHLLITPYRCTLLSTLTHSCYRKNKYPQISFTRTPALKSRPQVKGIVTKVTTMSPKKPNSAVRHVAKVALTNRLRVTTRLPGIGYLCAKYNRVLVEGGRANDLPGVGYTLIRGVYDFAPVISKKKRRSIYGVSRPDGLTKYVRKCMRNKY